MALLFGVRSGEINSDDLTHAGGPKPTPHPPRDEAHIKPEHRAAPPAVRPHYARVPQSVISYEAMAPHILPLRTYVKRRVEMMEAKPLVPRPAEDIPEDIPSARDVPEQTVVLVSGVRLTIPEAQPSAAPVAEQTAAPVAESTIAPVVEATVAPVVATSVVQPAETAAPAATTAPSASPAPPASPVIGAPRSMQPDVSATPESVMASMRATAPPVPRLFRKPGGGRTPLAVVQPPPVVPPVPATTIGYQPQTDTTKRESLSLTQAPEPKVSPWLVAGLAVAHAYNAASSQRIMDAGGHELNPLMHPYEHGGTVERFAAAAIGDYIGSKLVRHANRRTRIAAVTTELLLTILGTMHNATVNVHVEKKL